MSSDESERTVSVKQEDDSLRPKRKKTNRACNHCHKAHMTCDSGRPCKRCIQRGLDKTCEDARRKRKKYLADVPNTALLPNRLQQAETYDGTNASPTESGRSIMYQATTFQHSSTVPISYTNSINDDIYSLGFSKSHNSFLPRNQNQTQPLARSQSTFSQKQSTLPQTHSNLSSSLQSNLQQPDQQQQLPQSTDYMRNSVSRSTNGGRRTNFLSSAADLEYSTLSSILQDNFMHGNHSTSNEGTPNSITLSPALSPHALTTTVSSNTNTGTATRNMTTPDDLNYTSKRNKPYVAGSSQTPSPQDQLSNGSMEAKARISNASASIYDHQRYPKCDESINQYFLGPTESDQVSMFPDVITAIETMKASDPSVFYERNSKSALSFTIGIVPDDNHYTKNHDSVENESFYKEPEEIYAKVKKPFSYTPGYHSLIAYLRKRFNKPMLVKMAESMAAYRPSFIACTNSLKEGDLIFMEQCFQRTLLTYDNFIRVSGTPTIVWRRTGEIAYVGNEFCILTGWSKEELLGKQRKFIVELLDDKSVLEYFQLFSRIAFGDFLGATMTECTLLTPKTDVKIRTGCMWTLKRDVFGIPMMIVGNFLPIL